MFALSKKQGTLCAKKTLAERLAEVVVCAPLAAFLSLGVVPAQAQDFGGCGNLVGAYYLTVKSGTTVASNEVLNLTADGNAFVIDSGQGGTPGVFNPFTSEQGAWVCEGFSAHATMINFTLSGSVPNDQGSARADYTISPSFGRNSISGTIVLRFYSSTGNPLAKPLPASDGTYTFTGQAFN